MHLPDSPRTYRPLSFERCEQYSFVFSRRRDGKLTASNYVGVLTTPRQTVIEILPKIDFGDRDDTKYEETKEHFLKMLRSYRSLRRAAQLPKSSIQEMKRFPMLEVFIRQFLEILHVLVRGGIAWIAPCVTTVRSCNG